MKRMWSSAGEKPTTQKIERRSPSNSRFVEPVATSTTWIWFGAHGSPGGSALSAISAPFGDHVQVYGDPCPKTSWGWDPSGRATISAWGVGTYATRDPSGE